MKSALVFALGFLVLLAVACSGPTQPNGDVANCSYPATTASTPTTGDCNANRTFIKCQNSDGTVEACLTGNPNACADQDEFSVTCEQECQPAEYGAACGGSASDGGALSSSPPASGCRVNTTLAGGVVIYCCPCG